MEAKDYISICAIVLSPVIAVIITLWYQSRSEKIQTKKRVFFTLMKYRRSIHIPTEYVEALNSIDVVFYGQEKIINLWIQYYDALSSSIRNDTKTGHLHIDLLSAIAEHLGYENLKQTQIDRYYEPQLYQNQLARTQEISDELLRTLKASENYGTPRKTNDNRKKGGEIKLLE